MTVAMEKQSQALARPLPVLVPLIKEQLNLARIAAEEAGMPYYLQAGELLNEAKAQVRRGEFAGWLRRNFTLSQRTASVYMAFANSQRAASGQTIEYKTLSEFSDSRPAGHRPAWHYDVLEQVAHVDVRRLTQERMAKEKELRLIREVARQIVAIGYKVLATKFHPDKASGSREAMQRLNEAKSLLKQSL